MTSVSGDVNTSKLKFSVDSILGNNETSSSAPVSEARTQEPPCAGCVAALYRCCRDEPPLLQFQLPLPYAHLHPALRPTSEVSDEDERELKTDLSGTLWKRSKSGHKQAVDDYDEEDEIESYKIKTCVM